MFFWISFCSNHLKLNMDNTENNSPSSLNKTYLCSLSWLLSFRLDLSNNWNLNHWKYLWISSSLHILFILPLWYYKNYRSSHNSTNIFLFQILFISLIDIKKLTPFFFSDLHFYFYFFNFYFIFKLYNIVLVLPNIETNPPQVYPCSPSWTLLPPPSPPLPLGRPSAPAPSIQYRASNLDWRLISYMILYMFQCHSPKSSHPLPLPQSP